jgi:uncharacterized protein (DUF2342 family)
METMLYSQVQKLVGQLPAHKLPIAYHMLEDLKRRGSDDSSLQQNFMRLPVAERRRLMAKQAEQMMAHYEQTASERGTWQAGDFIEY